MDDIKVLIVDDQLLVREGIASLLDIQEGLRVVGTAENGRQAIEQAQALLPDVILMDVRMPVMDGIAATSRVRSVLPKCKVLMLTTFDDEEYVVKSLREGAVGYLLKDMPSTDLAQAIRLAHAGVYQVDPSAMAKLVGALPSQTLDKRQPPDLTEDLTARELEVLRLIAAGATNREIATQLFISEGTVKNHVSSILGRLGLRDRVQAALYAHSHGLI